MKTSKKWLVLTLAFTMLCLSGSAQGMLMAHTHRRGPFGLLVLGPRSWMPAMAHTAWA